MPKPKLRLLPRNVKDIKGQRFGKLTVIRFAGIFGQSAKHAYWCCQCDCGNVARVNGTSLRTGKCFSCGCNRRDVEAKRKAALRIPVWKRQERLKKCIAGIKRAASERQKGSRQPAYKLSVEQAAELSGLSEQRINSLCDLQILSWVTRKGRRRISARDLKDYIICQMPPEIRCDHWEEPK